jgi:hypothetical protein
MITDNEDMILFDDIVVVENKRALSANLAQHTREFLKHGGTVVVIPTGVSKYLEPPPVPRDGVPISGVAGINWSVDRKQWTVRTPNSRRHLGFANDLAEAVEMQRKHEAKQAWKESQI